MGGFFISWAPVLRRNKPSTFARLHAAFPALHAAAPRGRHFPGFVLRILTMRFGLSGKVGL